MDIQDGTASLIAAFTQSAFRGRGVQTALIRDRLALAAQSGCDLAMVDTDVGDFGIASQRNVLRAGFQLVYTALRMIAPAVHGAVSVRELQ